MIACTWSHMFPKWTSTYLTCLFKSNYRKNMLFNGCTSNCFGRKVLDFISNVEAVLKLSDIIFYQLESDMKNWTSELYDKNSE